MWRASRVETGAAVGGGLCLSEFLFLILIAALLLAIFGNRSTI